MIAPNTPVTIEKFLRMKDAFNVITGYTQQLVRNKMMTKQLADPILRDAKRGLRP
jgi:hypothetical protein